MLTRSGNNVPDSLETELKGNTVTWPSGATVILLTGYLCEHGQNNTLGTCEKLLAPDRKDASRNAQRMYVGVVKVLDSFQPVQLTSQPLI